jgi:glycosyltransferase involved in cell wall biosynthesis
MNRGEMSTEGEIIPPPLADVHRTFEVRARDDTPVITYMVPCLNEEGHVLGTLDSIVRACAHHEISFEIFVFDDASMDSTREKVKTFQSTYPKFPVALVCNPERQGVAANFVVGAILGRGRYYRMVNGDNVETLQTHMSIYAELGNADIIVPAYYKILNRKPMRTVISKIYTVIVNFISGMNFVYYNGCPVYLREDVAYRNVETGGLGFSAEILTKLVFMGRCYKEVPLVGNDQEGSTAMTWNNFFSVGASLLRIALRRIKGTRHIPREPVPIFWSAPYRE